MDQQEEHTEESISSNGNGAGEPLPADGVFVFSERQENGNLNVNLRVVGNVDPLSVPSLMEHAVKVARQSVGLAS